MNTPFDPGIYTHTTARSWALVTLHTTYALGVSEAGYLVNLHWGGRLASFDDLPNPQLAPEYASNETILTRTLEEYPGFGGLRYGEIAAKVEFADGVRDLDLRYERFEMGTDELDGLPCLTIYMHDSVYPLLVALRYRIDIADDLIIRSALLTNLGTAPMRLERAFSATWHLPLTYETRVLTTLVGQWAAETQIQRQPFVAGTTLIESRRGITSTNAFPWFALETDANASQELYFGTLAWSGNWLLRMTRAITGETTVAGGISDYDFVWQLKGNETFTTPDFIAGFTEGGFNAARQRLHRYVRDYVLPPAHAQVPRPVLYNSWEATWFDVREGSQSELAERAARMGVELFVVDDGWFLGRNFDNAGLGDWYADPQKFPRGLGPLIERVHALGMNFGLWVEPEMVNPDSNLYRAHPHWVYAFPTRQRSEARNQLVLNVGRDDVQAYIFELLDALVTRHPIAHLKWDMNRPISEPGWTEYAAQGGEAREIWVRHTLGVYAIIDALRARHPHLTIEACASGGGRADLAMLRRTDQVWTSDNTHPEARLLIQEGSSLFLPARAMGAWVTDAGRGLIPLAFRFHVSMLGALGIGGNLLHWSAEELDEAAFWIGTYKSIRHLVQDGEQSWLLSPHKTGGTLAAVQYTAPNRDEAAVFFFCRSHVMEESTIPIRLNNLDPNTQYRIEDMCTYPSTSPVDIAEASIRSGRALMLRGLPFAMARQQIFVSRVMRVRKVFGSTTGVILTAPASALIAP